MAHGHDRPGKDAVCDASTLVADDTKGPIAFATGGEYVSPEFKTDRAGKHDFVATITDPDTGDVIAQGECGERGEDGETSSVTAAKAKGLAFAGADHLDTYVGIGLATLMLDLIAKTVSTIRRRHSVPTGDPATTAITTMDEV